MPEFIRVIVKDTNVEQTIPKPSTLDESVYELVDGPAVDKNGRALPPKSATKSSKSGQKAATEKESN